MANEKPLMGKTALVTGAAKRLGQATALALAKNGVDLVLHGHKSLADLTATKIQAEALGARAWSVTSDLSSPNAAGELFGEVLSLVGKVDFLVNNASIFPSDRMADATWENLSENLKLNAWAPMALTREFAAQGREGAVVNLLDARIHDYDSEHLSYHLSKRMLHSLTRMTALEYAPNIRVNAVAPGLILPPEGKDGAYLQSLAHTNPLQRIGCVEDVADAIVFLFSNSFVTGQTIYVDGGRHMKGNIYGG